MQASFRRIGAQAPLAQIGAMQILENKRQVMGAGTGPVMLDLGPADRAAGVVQYAKRVHGRGM